MARLVTINSENEDQRIDNFIFKHLKGIPRVRVYRAIREGEVRVNKGRIKPSYRLQLKDEVRIPPLMGIAHSITKTPRPKVTESLLKPNSLRRLRINRACQTVRYGCSWWFRTSGWNN